MLFPLRALQSLPQTHWRVKKDLFNKCVWDRIPVQRAESDEVLFWAVGAAPTLVLVSLTLMKIPAKSRCLPHLDNSPVQKRTVPLHGSLGGLAVFYMMPAVPKPSWHPVPAVAHATALMSVVWKRRGIEDIAAGCTCMNNQAVALSTHMHAFTLPFLQAVF